MAGFGAGLLIMLVGVVILVLCSGGFSITPHIH
jgi:hypothetical protein